MTIRMIKGTTEYNGVPYYAGTSQDVIEDIDEKEGQRLIDLGYAERIPDPPPKPSLLFTESSEKVQAKINELEAKLHEAQDEKEALLSSDLQDVAGILKKVDVADTRVNSLQALISRQRIKLEQAEKAEKLAAEKAAVKKLAQATKEHCKEAKKILNGISDALTNIIENLDAHSKLSVTVKRAFYEAGGRSYDCPMLAFIRLPGDWTEWHFREMRETVERCLSFMDAAETQTPEKLQKTLNAKHYKSMDELVAERQRNQERMARERVSMPEIHSYNDTGM
jgi:hypothetical protein